MTIDISNPSTKSTEDSQQPIIIDLGKKSRKRIRKLRKGKPSRLLDKVNEVLSEIREAGALSGPTQAVVVVVRERRKSKVGKLWGMG